MRKRSSRRGRWVAAFSAAATLPLLLIPATAATADAPAASTKQLEAVAFSGPANLDRARTTAALKAGRSLASLGLQEAGRHPAPTLASYNQKLHARATQAAHAAVTGVRPSATVPPFDPTKEPPEITLSDCPDPAQGGGPLYEPDRFDMCEVRTFGISEYLVVDGTPTLQGVGYFTDTLIGLAGFGDHADRLLSFEDHISNVSQRIYGLWNPAITLFGASQCTPVLGSGDCHSRTDAHIATFAQWLLAGGDSWNFTLEVEPGGGVGRDDIIKEVLNEGFFVHPPPGYSDPHPDELLPMPDLDLRWDNASYVKAGDDSDGAAIFDDIPPLTYNLHGQGTDQVAAHIQYALANPDATIPKEPAGHTKTLPGYFDNPLHRLYAKYSLPRSQLRYDRNRYLATKQCGPRHGDECDEFPMTSTYEGAAKADVEPFSDPYAYSVRLVNKTQNGTAGTIAKLFYAYYRVLDPGFDINNHPRDWDSFYIQIL